MDKEYQHVISLGHACAVAHELEHLGYRDHSGPFDWCGSRSLKLKMKLLEENFEPLFSGMRIDNLYQRAIPNIYLMKEFQIYFVHDFNATDTLESQLDKVIEKYRRRVSQFYKDIIEPCLFIYYLYDQEDADWIDENHEYVLNFFRKYNQDSDILYITPTGINFRQKSFYVENDEGADHAYDFTQKKPEILDYLNKIPYPVEKKNQNLLFFNAKPQKSLIKRFIDRIKSRFSTSNPVYHHNLQSIEP
ncbi:Putative papain-like cysteine peptidase [Prevotella sp. khp1]|uniref:DUF1796 family putative cysteine peptidase n=1 Tax=Prevotellaceae TaxID=171552 RepID=UPI00088E4CFD|nr:MULTISPECIES: DUF1796 family putative cysteine peptidase [Prevotellaceae]QVJ80596.1 hypothetical protein J4031_13065 [Xylanibacter ruminicola]SDQ17994.1 Putative papain-like cysteine peptidase [Prevotella sp. khp1]